MRAGSAALVASLLTPVSTYTLDYYDCNNTNKVSSYQRANLCTHGTNASDIPVTYTLLQSRLD